MHERAVSTKSSRGSRISRGVLGRASHLTKDGKSFVAARETVGTGVRKRCARLSPLITFRHIRPRNPSLMTKQVDSAQLKAFSPIDSLKKDNLAALATKTKVRDAQPGET